MDRVAVDAVVAVLTETAVPARIEQIVKREPIVVRQRGTSLIFTSGLGAAIVQRDIEAEWKTLLIVDHQVAIAWLGSGFRRGDLNIGLSRRHAFEILQSLLDIAQIEDIALADR